MEIARSRPKWKIYAVDMSSNVLRVACNNLNDNHVVDKIVLLQANGKLLPFRNDTFDVVICSNLLHHLEEPVPLLNEMNRVVKKVGIILIRDLIRPPSSFILNLFVWIIGLPYDRLMKKEYRDSLCAAFTVKEYEQMLMQSDIKEAKIVTVQLLQNSDEGANEPLETSDGTFLNAELLPKISIHFPHYITIKAISIKFT